MFYKHYIFPYPSILLYSPLPYNTEVHANFKKKEKKEKLQPLNISTSQKKKQSPSPKPFTHREEQFQPLEYFTPKNKKGT